MEIFCDKQHYLIPKAVSNLRFGSALALEVLLLRHETFNRVVALFVDMHSRDIHKSHVE